jgi:hypothetical protein
MKHLRRRLINPAAFEDAATTARLQRAFDTYSEAKCRVLATVFVANYTWNVPTLVGCEPRSFRFSGIFK